MGPQQRMWVNQLIAENEGKFKERVEEMADYEPDTDTDTVEDRPGPSSSPTVEIMSPPVKLDNSSDSSSSPTVEMRPPVPNTPTSSYSLIPTVDDGFEPASALSTPLSTPKLSLKHHVLNIPSATSTPRLQVKYQFPDSDATSTMMEICRICHMPGDLEEILISPCRCAGTLQYIHHTCLMKWLEITTKKSRKPPKCELCHFQYHRHKKFKFHHWRLPRVSKQDKILHFIFIINLVIMIGCAVATVMCFLSDKGQITKFPRNKVDLTTEEVITLSCGVLFFVSFFIAMSVQIKAKHTIYQLFVKFIMQNMEWEIDEYAKAKDPMFNPGPVDI